MHALVVEAVPAGSLRSLAEPFEVLLAAIAGEIMLAGHVENLFLFQAAEYLLHFIEFSGLGKMRQVAGVDDEVGLMVECVDLIYGGLKSGGDIRIRCPLESDMAVADLNEREPGGAFSFRRLGLEQAGCRHAAGETL